MVELRQCPFCGEPAKIERQLITVDYRSRATCTRCGAVISKWFNTDTEAAQVWNTRAIVRPCGPLNCVLDEGGILPVREHETDAGLDLFTPEDVMVLPGDATWVDIRVRMEIPAGWFGAIKSKSGLAKRDGIIADTGVIDSGYTGCIGVRLWNTSRVIKRFSAGEKIAQLVLLPCGLSTPTLVQELQETERGDAGFGSTGK